ncbi:hypothetical protein [Neisseria meningitidis]|uniref:hypothetical protein n=1 Tax=Neisseria meningitidis TaxID=487 RepID=UPI001E615163|nr:hypothetical protein [Neisseria meningitidis]
MGYKLLLGLGQEEGTAEGEGQTQTIVSGQQLEQVRGTAHKASDESARNIGNQLEPDREKSEFDERDVRANRRKVIPNQNRFITGSGRSDKWNFPLPVSNRQIPATAIQGRQPF